MELQKPHHRITYRNICAKALKLPEEVSWKVIHRVRDAILFASSRTLAEIENQEPERHRQLLEEERSRQHGVFLFGLDKNSAPVEVDRFSRISELEQNDELKRKELATIFKLPKTAGWNEIRQIFSYLKAVAMKNLEKGQELEDKISDYLNIPVEFYKNIAGTIELSRDLEALKGI